jgi:hypothetical protein
MGDTPRRILLVAVSLVVAGWIAAILYALSQPSMGLRLVPYAPEGSEVVSRLRVADGPAGGPPAGATALRLQGAQDSVDLRAQDLIEEPDFIDTYPDMDAFFARQTRLATLMKEPQLVLHWQAAAGAPALTSTLTVSPRREMASLPLVFWFQLFAGAASLLIGAWVFALRPDRLGPAHAGGLRPGVPAVHHDGGGLQHARTRHRRHGVPLAVHPPTTPGRIDASAAGWPPSS